MTFRIVNIITILLLAILLLVHYCISPVHWWYFALVVWAYITIVFAGCINLSWNFFIPVTCKTNTNDKVIALSFDDGPSLSTTAILDILKQYNTPAAFFCIGKNIPANTQTLSRINEDGHLAGNHSYSHHFWFNLFSSAKMLADIQQTDKEVAKITGLKPNLFRPPYGVMNPNLAKAIRKGKYIPIGWSIRSFDTRTKDKQKLLSRIMAKVKPGGIILLHDSMEITAAILPELIQQLRGKNYNIVRLDKMLNINAYV